MSSRGERLREVDQILAAERFQAEQVGETYCAILTPTTTFDDDSDPEE